MTAKNMQGKKATQSNPGRLFSVGVVRAFRGAIRERSVSVP